MIQPTNDCHRGIVNIDRTKVSIPVITQMAPTGAGKGIFFQAGKAIEAATCVIKKTQLIKINHHCALSLADLSHMITKNKNQRRLKSAAKNAG